jgi:hypothetical protein
MTISGNAQPSLAKDGTSVALSHAGKRALLFRGLAVTDASGRALHAWLVLNGNQLQVRVDALGARYPVHVDPFVQQGEKLEGTAREEINTFGTGVAISANRSTAIIGAPETQQGGGPGRGGEEPGAAWVFKDS